MSEIPNFSAIVFDRIKKISSLNDSIRSLSSVDRSEISSKSLERDRGFPRLDLHSTSHNAGALWTRIREDTGLGSDAPLIYSFNSDETWALRKMFRSIRNQNQK